MAQPKACSNLFPQVALAGSVAEQRGLEDPLLLYFSIDSVPALSVRFLRARQTAQSRLQTSTWIIRTMKFAGLMLAALASASVVVPYARA